MEPSDYSPTTPSIERDSKHIKIVEVGPRDGLQNEKTLISTAVKLDYINHLVEAGLKFIEVTSFVNPKAIPQLSDALEVVQGLPTTKEDVVFSALVPNLKGLERALASGIRSIAVFTGVSNTFTVKNINMTVDSSLKTFDTVVQRAKKEGLTVRGYVSTAFYCPYEGTVKTQELIRVSKALIDMGIEELSIGDTIGKATPSDIDTTMPQLIDLIPKEKLAMHFHDTNGLAIENVEASLALGIRTFDSSAGGLGGCPYAPGASGNLPTERLVNYLHQHGFQTSVDLEALKKATSVIHNIFANTQV